MARPRVRNQLLQAARTLLDEQGIDALTTRAVAERAGVTEASLFNNFQGKAGLLRALVQEASPEFDALVDAARQPAEQPVEWVINVFERAVLFFHLVLPLSGSGLHANRPSLQRRNPEPQMNFAALKQVVKGLETLPLPTYVDPQTAALMIMGSAMHNALTHITVGQSAIGLEQREIGRRLATTLGL